MSVSVTLNIPAGDGVGTPSSVANLALEKNIIVGGTFTGAVTVEASMGGDYVPIATFTQATNKVVKLFAVSVRVRRAATQPGAPGTPTVDVTAEQAVLAFQQLEVPAGNGVGAAADISTFDENITALVTGDFDGAGALSIEVSVDGVNFSALGPTFSAADHFTTAVSSPLARVRRSAVTYGSAPVVYVGGQPAVASGSGAYPKSTLASSGTLDVFVSPNGDDANTGLSASDPLQTIGAVYRKFATSASYPAVVVINLADDGAGGVATYEVAPVRFNDESRIIGAGYRYEGPQMVAFAPSTGPSIATLDAGTPAERVDVLGAVSATGLRTRLLFTTAAPGWTVDDFANDVTFARITRGGQRVIYEMPISSNDADAIYLDNEDIVGLVQAGDTVEIVQPGATLQAPPAEGYTPFESTSGGLLGNAFGGQVTFRRLRFPFVLCYNALFSMDRCSFGGSFLYGSTAAFTRCKNSALVITGSSGSGRFNASKDAAGELAPINGDNSARIALQMVDSFARLAFGSGGAGLSWNQGMSAVVLRERVSIRTLNSVVADQQLLHACHHSLFVDGPLLLFAPAGSAGCGVRVIGAYVKLPKSTEADASTANYLADVLLTASGATINFGTGVGELDEVAGFNGNFHDFPAAPGDQGDFSIVNTNTFGA